MGGGRSGGGEVREGGGGGQRGVQEERERVGLYTLTFLF